MIVKFSAVIIVNTTMSCVIKLHGQYVFLSAILLVVGVVEHRGRCSPKGEDFVIALG